MNVLLICAVALAASGLTFFSGFGLGTLLLPAFALFFPVEVAIALTAVVHLLNGLFKLALLRRSVTVGVALRFGLPAMAAAWLGARALGALGDLSPLYTYDLFGRRFAVMPLKLAVAGMMAVFATLEIWPAFKQTSVPTKYLPLGGILTGFLGGLSGHQGAFRSVFLLRTGLTKDGFIATGAAIAAAIDVSRLSVYWARFATVRVDDHGPLLVAATLSAFAGALLGNRLLEKVTMRAVEIAVAVLLVGIAVGLASGLL